MHDLAWPGRQKANIDHLVVGPEASSSSTRRTGPGRWRSATACCARTVVAGALRERVRRAVAAVQRLVPEVPMQPVLSLHGDLAMKERVDG